MRVNFNKELNKAKLASNFVLDKYSEEDLTIILKTLTSQTMEEEPEHMNLNKSSFLKELFIERP
jgi:hypothetical protein